jgi:hypothetical protein
MFDDDFDPIRSEDTLSESHWTLRRVIYLLIILITLIAFLVYVLSGTFFPPAPPPILPLPRQQV